MKTAVLATLLTSAAAFAPVQKDASSTSLAASFDKAIGAQAPLGFWDPLGLCDGADQAKFDRLRFMEVKHGRVAMLAIVGHMVTTAGVRLPGLISYDGTKFSDIPAGLAAISKVPQFGLAQIVLFAGFLELFVMKDAKGTGATPGDFLNGIGWSASAEEKREKLSIELNNGRAAQMGILGLVVHEKLTGEPYVLNAFLGYPSHFNEGF